MQKNDQLKLQILNIENTLVYVAKGKGYRWINHLDQMAETGDVFDTRMDWQFYITGVGNNFFPGTFQFKAWIEKGTANNYVTPVTVEKQENKPVEIKEKEPEPEKVEEKEEPKTDTNNNGTNGQNNNDTSTTNQ
jgi:hypothetical protein